MDQADSPPPDNRSRVIDVLRRHGTASRGDLIRLTGLSRTTITSVVGDLGALGLVTESPAADGGDRRGRSARGRPTMRLRLDSAAGIVLGVDIGHGALRTAIADLTGSMLAERSVPCDVADRDAAMRAALGSADALIAEAGVSREALLGVGVAVTGPLSRRVALPSRLLPRWLEDATPEDFESLLGAPAVVDNDANLAAFAEHCVGVARGIDDMVGVMIGDGIGGGLVLDGRPYAGAGGMAGELGHVQVDPDGSLCRCGNRGCLGTVAAAGPLLDLLRPVYGDGLTVEGMLELVGAGEEGPRRLIEDAGRAVGRVLGGLCNHLNPACIVIGGSVGAAGAPLLAGVREGIDRHALPAVADMVDVVAGKLGPRAPLLGAIHRAPRSLNSRGSAGRRWRRSGHGLARDPVAAVPCGARADLEPQPGQQEHAGEHAGRQHPARRPPRLARAVRRERRRRRHVRRQRVAGEAGDPPHRGHRRARKRVAVGTSPQLHAPEQRASVGSPHRPEAAGVHGPARDADAVRRDDDQRRAERPLRLEVGREPLRVALRPCQHLRRVGDVVRAPDERHLDRVPRVARRVQQAEQLELDRLRRRVGERGIERVRLEVVSRRIAVAVRGGRSAAQHRERGDERGGRAGQGAGHRTGTSRGRRRAPPLRSAQPATSTVSLSYSASSAMSLFPLGLTPPRSPSRFCRLYFAWRSERPGSVAPPGPLSLSIT
jgi:predicted NBD/HSP70 family sugar kinase